LNILYKRCIILEEGVLGSMVSTLYADPSSNLDMAQNLMVQLLNMDERRLGFFLAFKECFSEVHFQLISFELANS